MSTPLSSGGAAGLAGSHSGSPSHRPPRTKVQFVVGNDSESINSREASPAVLERRRQDTLSQDGPVPQTLSRHMSFVGRLLSREPSPTTPSRGRRSRFASPATSHGPSRAASPTPAPKRSPARVHLGGVHVRSQATSRAGSRSGSLHTSRAASRTGSPSRLVSCTPSRAGSRAASRGVSPSRLGSRAASPSRLGSCAASPSRLGSRAASRAGSPSRLGSRYASHAGSLSGADMPQSGRSTCRGDTFMPSRNVSRVASRAVSRAASRVVSRQASAHGDAASMEDDTLVGLARSARNDVEDGQLDSLRAQLAMQLNAAEAAMARGEEESYGVLSELRAMERSAAVHEPMAPEARPPLEAQQAQAHQHPLEAQQAQAHQQPLEAQQAQAHQHPHPSQHSTANMAGTHGVQSAQPSESGWQRPSAVVTNGLPFVLPPPVPHAQTAGARMERAGIGKRRMLLAEAAVLPANMKRDVWSLDDYDVHKELSTGYASYVYYATCRISGTPVALKVYRMKKLSDLSRYQVYREISVHAGLNHPNIVQLYAAFQEGTVLVMVQEFAEGGDLYSFLQKHLGCLTEELAVDVVLRPLLRALTYCHAHGICHRDIKLENILLTKDRVIKLADFGLAVDLCEERAVTRAGTLDYMAPEVLCCPPKLFPEENKHQYGLAYGAGADVWSLGVLAYELVMGTPPFPPTNQLATAARLREAPPKLPVLVSAACRSFVQCTLRKTPTERPSMAQLTEMPWIAAQEPQSTARIRSAAGAPASPRPGATLASPASTACGQGHAAARQYAPAPPHPRPSPVHVPPPPAGLTTATAAAAAALTRSNIVPSIRPSTAPSARPASGETSRTARTPHCDGAGGALDGAAPSPGAPSSRAQGTGPPRLPTPAALSPHPSAGYSGLKSRFLKAIWPGKKRGVGSEPSSSGGAGVAEATDPSGGTTEQAQLQRFSSALNAARPQLSGKTTCSPDTSAAWLPRAPGALAHSGSTGSIGSSRGSPQVLQASSPRSRAPHGGSNLQW